MITFLIRAFIFLASAALGLLVADLLLPGFRIDWSNWWGFVLAIVIFATLQSVLSPWIATVARRNAPALLGGIGIFSTLIALVIVVLIPGAGLTIGQPFLLTWVLAPVIVWLVTALATLFLPMLLLKKRLDERRDKKAGAAGA
ncbi:MULTISPECIES: hypothetical protein [Microbacterium]|uniref:Superfamily IV 4 TMS phage holin n=1 Tax=Microbacterium aurantiacum TaxID=162393 RepID=A0ABT8FR30_9MICO|nr:MULTISPECIES: hypothetical protein [Microbacterium]MBN9199965.1 hypothetical protein [Microbacterium chocolatum]MDN4463630.1 hypothetical protein [Microbacterium aurantiacum]ODT39685.1 MAG: hypothetical protein ABS60_05960 [Microbacterium sp. SCN 71-17]